MTEGEVSDYEGMKERIIKDFPVMMELIKDFSTHISYMYDISFERGVKETRRVLDKIDEESRLYHIICTEFASRLNEKYFVFCEEDYFIFYGKKFHHIVCAADIETLLKSADIQKLSKLVGKIHPKKIGELARELKKDRK
jgi:hypothetical protein